METTACPFCNADLPPLSAPPGVAKLPCPRCGDLVPAEHWRVQATGIREGLPSAAPAPHKSDERRAANRRTAGIIVGIMLAMATIGGSYALWTTRDRQARHPWMPKKDDPITFRRPLELPALGHLPKDCKLLAGLHVAEMLADEKAGKKLLAKPRPTLFDWPLKQIARTSGLSVEEIDHVALGAADLTLVMVIKTRESISLEKIADARPVRSGKHEERPFYEFTLEPMGSVLVWSLDDRTLVYVARIDAVKAEHLRAVAVKPRPIKEVAPEPWQSVVLERLPKQNFAWAAGRPHEMDELKFLRPFLIGMQKELAVINDLKNFTIGLTPDDGLTLVGNFQRKDSAAGAKFKGQLDALKIEGATVKAALTEPTAAEQWVSWQVRSDAEALRRWLTVENGGK